MNRFSVHAASWYVSGEQLAALAAVGCVVTRIRTSHTHSGLIVEFDAKADDVSLELAGIVWKAFPNGDTLRRM
jgi:hypothetical protein